MKREIITSVVCSIVLLFSTCKKEVGPAGPELSGTIMGFVTLYNSLGERIADAKGVLVRIDGTNPRTVLTDSIGEYQLDSIKTGIYNITFSKDSFNTFKRIGQQFVGGSDPVISNVTLYVPSINAVSNLTLTVVNNQVKVTGT